MTIVQQLEPRPNPRVTFSALVEVLSSPTHRLIPILQSQKYPKPGPVFGYKKAVEQLVQHFVNGAQLDPASPDLREHEAYAIAAVQQVGPAALMPAEVTSCSVHPRSSSWFLGAVEVSFSPDLLVEGTVRRSRATGAVKFYMRKDPTSVGPTMAALLYYHRSQVIQDPDTDPELCVVSDVQSGIFYTASGNYQRLLQQAQTACNVIAAVWPTI